MKHIVRAGLGFLGGLFALLGGAIIKEDATNPLSWVFGVISLFFGIALFYYGYKG